VHIVYLNDLVMKIDHSRVKKEFLQRRSQGGVFGVKPPTSLENFFNLLGFFEKKHQNPPKNFKTPS